MAFSCRSLCLSGVLFKLGSLYEQLAGGRGRECTASLGSFSLSSAFSLCVRNLELSVCRFLQSCNSHVCVLLQVTQLFRKRQGRDAVAQTPSQPSLERFRLQSSWCLSSQHVSWAAGPSEAGQKNALPQTAAYGNARAPHRYQGYPTDPTQLSSAFPCTLQLLFTGH